MKITRRINTIEHVKEFIMSKIMNSQNIILKIHEIQCDESFKSKNSKR